MGWTYTTLQEAASAFLDGFTDDFFATMFPVCVRQAEERILHVTKVQPIRRRESVVGTIGSELVSEVPDLLAPISVSANNVPLLLRETNWISEVFGDNSISGTPAYYAIRQRIDNQSLTEIVTAPPSNTAVNFVLEYMAKPTSLVDSQDGTWISNNCENALLYGVLFHAYSYEKGEADILAGYKEEFEKALSLLKGITLGLRRKDDFRSSPQAQPES